MHCQNKFHWFWSRCLRGSPQRKKHLASIKKPIPDTAVRASSSGAEFTGAHLADQSYWEERYAKSGGKKHFDWLATGDTTLDLIIPFLRPGAKVLDLGCGTSSFALQLARVSPVPVQVPPIWSPTLSLIMYVQVFCLDYSRAALASMKQLYEEMFNKSGAKKPAVHFVHGNATKMPFKKNTFDLVLDKGTTDSVLKFEDRTQAHLMAKKIQNEALRIISPHGVYVQITDEDPDLRLSLLRDNVVMDSSVPCDFSVSYRDISEDESWQHFMYILSLNPDC